MLAAVDTRVSSLIGPFARWSHLSRKLLLSPNSYAFCPGSRLGAWYPLLLVCVSVCLPSGCGLFYESLGQNIFLGLEKGRLRLSDVGQRCGRILWQRGWKCLPYILWTDKHRVSHVLKKELFGPRHSASVRQSDLFKPFHLKTYRMPQYQWLLTCSNEKKNSHLA